MTDISDEDLVAAAAEVLGDAPEVIEDDPIIDGDPIVDEDTVTDPEPEDEPEDGQAEFAASMSYDEYIEKGLPPEKYMGPEALESFRKMVGDRKVSRNQSNEFKALNARLDADANARTQAILQDQRTQQQSKIAALEAQIAESKDSLDTEGLQKALEAKHELTADLERTKVEPQKEHAVVTAYRTMNPKLDVGGAQYDQAYEADFIQKLGEKMSAFGQDFTGAQLGESLRGVESDLDGSAPPAQQRRTAPRVASSRGTSNGAGSAAQKAVAKMGKETQGLYKQWANGSAEDKLNAKQLIEDYS
jgi:hypothetical protein